MNILTGYNGFIGSHLANKIENKFLLEKKDCFSFLLDFDNWKDVECVYHIGAISNTTETDVNKLYQYNVKFTLELFERCIEHKIPVKWVSSGSVFGNTFTNVGGRSINPLNQYAFSKAIVEQWVMDNLDRFERFEGYRLFNVYGDGEADKGSQASPITIFRKQAVEEGVIRIFERSDAYLRDFVSVDDVVSVMTGDIRFHGIFDLGTSRVVSFEDVAKLVQRKYGGIITEIPFPKHLKDKYQYYTRAQQHFNYRFKTVEEWLSL